MTAALNRIVKQLHQLEALDPAALGAVEMLVTTEAIDIRSPKRSNRGPQPLDVRLRRAHPSCTGVLIQQPPHNGRRSWRCGTCGEIFSLPERG